MKRTQAPGPAGSDMKARGSNQRITATGVQLRQNSRVNTNYVISCDDLWDRVRGEPSTSAR